MIIDAFKNKIFPMAPTGFREDEEPSGSRDEEEKDRRLPTIKEEEALEQIAKLDKFYGPGLINKYFLENSLTRIINK